MITEYKMFLNDRIVIAFNSLPSDSQNYHVFTHFDSKLHLVLPQQLVWKTTGDYSKVVCIAIFPSEYLK